MASKFLVLLVSALLSSIAQGAPILSADVQTCIDLCTSCSGVATFVDNRCECMIEENNNDGRECLMRMRREAEEHGLDLGSCNFNSDQRTTRCSVGSKHRFSKNEIEKVAKYFLQNGPGTVGSIFRAPPYEKSIVSQPESAAKSSNCDCSGQVQQMTASPKSDCVGSSQQGVLNPQQFVGSPASQPMIMSPIHQQYMMSPVHQQFIPNPLSQPVMLSPVTQQYIPSAMLTNPQQYYNGNPVSSSPTQFLGSPLSNQNAPCPSNQQLVGSPSPNSPVQQLLGSPSPNSPAQQLLGSPSPNSPAQQLVGSPSPNSPAQQLVGSPSPSLVGSPSPNSPTQQLVGSPSPNSPSSSLVGSPSPNSPSPSFVGSPSPSLVGSPSPKSPSPSLVGSPSPNSPSSSLVGSPSPNSPSPSLVGSPSPSLVGSPSPNSPDQQSVGSPSPNQNNPSSPNHQTDPNTPVQQSASNPVHEDTSNPASQQNLPPSTDHQSQSNPKSKQTTPNNTAKQNAPNSSGKQSQANATPKQGTHSNPAHQKVASLLSKLAKPNTPAHKNNANPKTDNVSGPKIITQPKETMPASKERSNDDAGGPRIITQPKETMPDSNEPDNEEHEPNSSNPKVADDEEKPLVGQTGRDAGIPDVSPALFKVLSQQFSQPMLGIPQAIQTLGKTPGIVDIVSAPGNLLKTLVQRLNAVPLNALSAKQAVQKSAKPLNPVGTSKAAAASPANKDCAPADEQHNLEYNVPLGLMNSQQLLGLLNPNMEAAAPISYMHPMTALSGMPMFHNPMLGTIHSIPTTTYIIGGSPFGMPFMRDFNNGAPTVAAINPAMIVEDPTSKAAKAKMAQSKKVVGQSEPSAAEEPASKPQKKICKKSNKEEVSKKMTRDANMILESPVEEFMNKEEMKTHVENQKQTTTMLPKIDQTTTQKPITEEPVEQKFNIDNSIIKQKQTEKFVEISTDKPRVEIQVVKKLKPIKEVIKKSKGNKKSFEYKSQITKS